MSLPKDEIVKPEKFKEINEAYQVLGNKEKSSVSRSICVNFKIIMGKGLINKALVGLIFSNFQQDFNFDSDFDLGDIFDGFFDGRSAPHQTSRSNIKRGRYVRVEVEISFVVVLE